MATAKTWIIVILAAVGVCVLALMVLAGVGAYYVAKHVSTASSSPAAASRTFDDIRAGFKAQAKPILELDENERPHIGVRIADLPTSTSKPTDMHVAVFDMDKGQMVKIAIPFWILRLGRQKYSLFSGRSDVTLEDLHLDIRELERVGPMLVLDFRAPGGDRVMIWTK